MRSALGRHWIAVIAALLLVGLLPLHSTSAATIGPAPDVPDVIPNDRLGIAHVTYGGLTTDPGRYQLATNAGARWNRWVAYWHEIERQQGVFDYSRYDANVRADIEHGLQLEVVLMGTPGFYATTTAAQTQAIGQGVTTAASAPRNLDKPIFADGSDVPAPGKAINPENYWARFVSLTVNRYKGSVRYWEMWNEQDNTTFWWNGDNQELKRYVRLLKVGYLAAKSADPNAQVLLGGLMSWEWINRTGTEHAWLRAFVKELSADPDRARFGNYFDILPLHWYARSADVYNRTNSARQLLTDAGITGKVIWINETNLGVCGDPQLRGKPDCTPGVAKGRLEEQASFIVQAIANAFAAGVDKVFAFQLLDDSLGPFENYGLVRNDGSRRPAYSAFQVAASHFRDIKTAVRVGVPPVETVTMVGKDGRVVVVAWNADSAPVTVAIPARQSRATLIDQTGKTTNLNASSGAYQLTLPGATFNLSAAGARADYPVGGLTYIIAESPPPKAPAATVTPAAAPDQQVPSPDRPVQAAPPPSPTPATVKAATPPALSAKAQAAPPVATPPTPPALIGATPATAAAAVPEALSAVAAAFTAAQQPVQAEPADESRLLVPASLSTVRVSDLREDGFTVSWLSDAPAIGALRCGVDQPLADTYKDVRGDVRTTVHFVEVRGLRPDTSYRCEASAGVEVDDNGGTFFSIRTLARSETQATWRLAGSVVTEDGRPASGAIVYATVPNGRDGRGSVSVRATLTNDSGRWQLDVPYAIPGDRPIAVAAVSSSGFAAERSVRTAEDLSPALRLAFQWSLYRTATIGLPRGLSDLSLPIVPLNGRTIDDFVREVAARGGGIADVYWWEGGQWYGGRAPGSNEPFVFGRQYLIRVEKAVNWTLRGFDPQSVGLAAPPAAVVRFGLPSSP